jgi:hypothetical protein
MVVDQPLARRRVRLERVAADGLGFLAGKRGLGRRHRPTVLNRRTAVNMFSAPRAPPLPRPAANGPARRRS